MPRLSLGEKNPPWLLGGSSDQLNQ